jgi:hypothetical protein
MVLPIGTLFTLFGIILIPPRILWNIALWYWGESIARLKSAGIGRAEYLVRLPNGSYITVW